MPLTELYLKALLGAAIPIKDTCMVYPLKIKDIIGMGEEKYRQHLGMLTLTSYDLYELYRKRGVAVSEDINVFDNLMESCENDNSFLLDMQEHFSTFIRERVQILPELKVFSIGNPLEKKILSKEEFEFFQNILRIQNRIPVEEKAPTNESPMQRKFRLKREMVKRAKKKQSEKSDTQTVTLHDLISSLCVYNIGINFQNVGELTIYQFHELLDRAQAKEKYDFDMRCILAGANSKKIRPEYWIKNLNNT